MVIISKIKRLVNIPHLVNIFVLLLFLIISCAEKKTSVKTSPPKKVIVQPKKVDKDSVETNKVVKTETVLLVEEEIEETPNPSSDIEYIVKLDETLWQIAQKVYGDYLRWEDIYETNKMDIEDPNVIFPKQVLFISASADINEQGVSNNEIYFVKDQSDVYYEGENIIVKEGETLWKIAEDLYDDASKWALIYRANSIQDPDFLLAGQTLLIPNYKTEDIENNVITDTEEETLIEEYNVATDVEEETLIEEYNVATDVEEETLIEEYNVATDVEEETLIEEYNVATDVEEEKETIENNVTDQIEEADSTIDSKEVYDIMEF